MRAIFIIARREYLSYVATVGFWLSLLAIPVFATLGAVIPALIEGSQPTRYFTIIDQTGVGYDQIVRDRLESQQRERIRDALEGVALAFGGEETAARALELFDSDPDGTDGLNAAMEELGLPGMADVVSAGDSDMIQVEAPSVGIEELRPYLNGEQMLETPGGERSLFAVFVIENSDTDPLKITYYSTSVADTAVRERVVSSLRSHLRRQAFMERGLSEEDIRTINALRPDVISIDARPGADGQTEVTVADRAPFVAAMIFAFVLWIAVFSVANMLLSSMVEEKGGKIIELLLSTARLHEILIGKLFGVAGVSITLFAIWGGIGFGLSTYGASFISFNDPDLLEFLSNLFNPGLLLAAFMFFIVGYLMYGSLFLAMGALCDTMQDAQTLMGPVIWMLMLPMFFIFFTLQTPDAAFIKYASWFPLWTPFIMLVRLPNDVPMIELVLTSGSMVVTMIGVLWAATLVFRQGALGMADAGSVRRFFRLKGRSKA
jgi:ABC-2 type transport system permease protein